MCILENWQCDFYHTDRCLLFCGLGWHQSQPKKNHKFFKRSPKKSFKSNQKGAVRALEVESDSSGNRGTWLPGRSAACRRSDAVKQAENSQQMLEHSEEQNKTKQKEKRQLRQPVQVGDPPLGRPREPHAYKLSLLSTDSGSFLLCCFTKVDLKCNV